MKDLIFLAASDEDRKEVLVREFSQDYECKILTEGNLNLGNVNKPVVFIAEDKPDPIIDIVEQLHRDYTCVLCYSDSVEWSIRVFHGLSPSARTATVDLSLGGIKRGGTPDDSLLDSEKDLVNDLGFQVIKSIRDLDPYIAPVVVSNFPKHSAFEDMAIKRLECAYYVDKRTDDFDRLADIVADSIKIRSRRRYNVRDEWIHLFSDFPDNLMCYRPSPDADQHEIEKRLQKIDFGDFFYDSTSPMRRVFEKIARIIDNGNIPVMIRGKAGTGKTRLAKLIHNNSCRRKGPFVTVTVAELNPQLIESELFGHEEGAFTDAKEKIGKLELANGGTLFMDEIGDIDPPLQRKLLRFLQDHEFERVGGTKTIKADVRLIFSTNRDLEELKEAGEIRGDFYDRINCLSIDIPSLREMKSIIPGLYMHFLEKFTKANKQNVRTISPEAWVCIKTYDWPGNIREFEKAIEGAVALCLSGVITPELLPKEVRSVIEVDLSTNIPQEPIPHLGIEEAEAFFLRVCGSEDAAKRAFKRWEEIMSDEGADEHIKEHIIKWRQCLNAKSTKADDDHEYYESGETAHEYYEKLHNERVLPQQLKELAKGDMTPEQREKQRNFASGVALYAILVNLGTTDLRKISKKYFQYRRPHGFKNRLKEYGVDLRILLEEFLQET